MKRADLMDCLILADEEQKRVDERGLFQRPSPPDRWKKLAKRIKEEIDLKDKARAR